MRSTLETVWPATTRSSSKHESNGDICVVKLVAETRKTKLPETLGFREGTSSVHTSRTMMLGDLSLVLEQVAPKAKREEFLTAIVEQNVLGKPTQTTRKRSAQRLVELYSLDQSCPLFRLLRHFWTADLAARPMLAFLAAVARDPLLRDTTPFVIAIPVGAIFSTKDVAQHLEQRSPARFKQTTLVSTAQNLASSWTQAGYLSGKINKKRSRPVVTPVVATFALLLGYLCGSRGKLLLDTVWTRMLDRTLPEITGLATEASRQGWMTYKSAGSVMEITFPGLLTPQEEKATYVPD